MILLLWDILSVWHFADLINLSIIGGKYIFRAKVIKPPKKTGLGFCTCFYFLGVFFFWVGFFNASPGTHRSNSLKHCHLPTSYKCTYSVRNRTSCSAQP